MAFHALSLAILGLALPSTALPLTSPALMPSVAGWDCSDPLNLTISDASGRCAAAAAATSEETPVYIVQHNDIKRYRGYKCKVTINTVQFICGLWSYEKHLSTSGGTLPYPVSGEKCEQMVSSGKFRTGDRDKFNLQIPGFSTFRVQQAGYSGVKDGDETCQGVDTVRNGKLEKRLVEYAIYTVTISPEKFVSDTQASVTSMVAASTQETITCGATSGHCSGELHSYTWSTAPHAECQYSLVKRAMGVLSPTTFFSHEEALVFARHPALPPIAQCPGLELLPTQVPGIFLSIHQPRLPTVSGADVRVSALVEALGAYVQDALEVHQGQLLEQAVRQHCLQAQQTGLQEAVPLGQGQFGKRLGDVWQQYTCTAVTVPVREAEHCMSAIPVTHPSLGFLNFRTRVLQATASAEPCLEHFPVRVRTTTGWIRLLPAVAAEPAPRPAQQAAHVLHHHADRPTGLYTEHELQEWQHLQSVPAFRRTVTADLAQGGCHEWGNCPLTQIPGGTQYSFSGMEQKLLQAVWPTWLTVIGQIMQYFAMVSGALFVPYLVIQKCRQAATTTSAGATYNYLTQAAPAQAAVTTTSFQQAIAVGGATSEATPAAPHQGGCSNFTDVDSRVSQNEIGASTALFMGEKISV